MAAFLFGGPEEIRTPDPHNANVVRSQLRYKPVPVEIINPIFFFVKKKENRLICKTVEIIL